MKRLCSESKAKGAQPSPGAIAANGGMQAERNLKSDGIVCRASRIRRPLRNSGCGATRKFRCGHTELRRHWGTNPGFIVPLKANLRKGAMLKT